MKVKIIAAFCTAAILLLMGGCTAAKPETVATGGTETTFEGISVTVTGVEYSEKETVLEVQWRNDTRYPVLYGEMFAVQKQENNQWVDCKMNDDCGFITIGYGLEPGKTVSKTYKLRWLYGELAPGRYRFTTTCNVYVNNVSQDCRLSAEFTLGEKGASEPQIKGALSSPPNLTIGGLTDAILGAYSWSCELEDGTWSHICTDSIHPLQMEKQLEVITPDNAHVYLKFDNHPDDYTVRCWQDSDIGNTNAKSEAVTVWNNRIQLKTGGYIYEVTATWNDDGAGYYGTVTYVFYAAPAMLYDVMPIGVTTDLYIAGEVVTLDQVKASTVNTILSGLTYDKSQVSDCEPEYIITLANGVSYGINLTEGYVRCDVGDGTLTSDHIVTLTAIIQWAEEKTKAR